MAEGAEPGRDGSPLLAVTGLPGASGALAVAAALGVAAARRAAAAAGPSGAASPGGDDAAGVLLCAADAVRRRPTLLSSAAARNLEERSRGALRCVARGAFCWAALDEAEWQRQLELARSLGAAVVVVRLEPASWRELMADPHAGACAAVVRGDLGPQRPLTALVAMDLRRRGVPAGVVTSAPGKVATRRALAGIEPGGPLGSRADRLIKRLFPRWRSDSGQALPLVLGLALLAVAAGALVALLGSAATGASRLQSAADLAAVSAARSMRDDHSRLFLPARTPSGAPNPMHLSEREYRARARAAARKAADANRMDDARLRVRFPEGSFAPTRVRVALAGSVSLAGRDAGRGVEASAVAEAYPPAAAAGTAVETASGGGYSGRLSHRQGKPMRPDVAQAFDRLAKAARRAGHALIVSSGFRSDAEQAALFVANPDPRWVARPGTSLHRCATELDLGPPGAYAWLASNAARFGFVRRYSWEAWHFGYTAGPAPCSTAGDRVGARAQGDGASAARDLPAFVPARFRDPIARAAARWNVPAALLAAQLLAESGFNPLAISPAGARGIAQFMPGTAAAYGLRDPFDPKAAIMAQGRLMAELLQRFDSVALALAAYNAGPAPVAACGCVPDYPETRAYVARILGLLGGAGQTAPPELEVRLIR